MPVPLVLDSFNTAVIVLEHQTQTCRTLLHQLTST